MPEFGPEVHLYHWNVDQGALLVLLRDRKIIDQENFDSSAEAVERGKSLAGANRCALIQHY